MLTCLRISKGIGGKFDSSFEWIFNESLYYKPGTILGTEEVLWIV